MIENHFFHNRAFVLANYASGEADRILVLLTEDFGKIQVTIPGIRKSKRRERVATEVLSYVDFTFYKKGEQFIVNNFTALEIFMNIRTQLHSLGLAFYLVHLVDKLILDGYRVPKIFQLLKNSLSYLEKEEESKKQMLLVLYFLFRMLKEEGIFGREEFLKSLYEEEKELFYLLEKNAIPVLQETEKYCEDTMKSIIKKLENYVSDKLDTTISIDACMMGGTLC